MTKQVDDYCTLSFLLFIQLIPFSLIMQEVRPLCFLIQKMNVELIPQHPVAFASMDLRFYPVVSHLFRISLPILENHATLQRWVLTFFITSDMKPSANNPPSNAKSESSTWILVFNRSEVGLST